MRRARMLPPADPGLYALQHRGQERGDRHGDQCEAADHPDGMGLVSNAFHEDDLKQLPGHIAVGHLLFGPPARIRSAMPDRSESIRYRADRHRPQRQPDEHPVKPLHRELENEGVQFLHHRTSEVLLEVVARTHGLSFVEKMRVPCHAWSAYSLAVLVEDRCSLA